jgi:hypothetical protein
MNELRKLRYSGKYSEMPEICSKCFMYLEMTEEFRVFLEKWALDNNLPVLFPAEKTESDDKDELINIANMKIEQGDYEKAEDLLKKVSKEFSEDEKLLSAFISLYNKKNDFKKIIDISEKLYEKTSKIRYLEEKAHSLFMLKEFEKSYKIYRFLYRKERKPVYLSALIDLQYSLKNEIKIRAIIKYFSLFCIKNSDYDFVYKLADFFYFYFLFNKKNSQKSWKDLCRYLFKNDNIINKDTFRKFFYIKRKFDFHGADYLFAEVLIKNRNILDEKMVIELVYFEMEKSDFDKNWVIYILTEFIKTELYFALEIYEKLELNKSEILQRLIEINEREKNIHSSFIKTYLKNNKMHRELFVFSIKKIFNL